MFFLIFSFPLSAQNSETPKSIVSDFKLGFPDLYSELNMFSKDYISYMEEKDPKGFFPDLMDETFEYLKIMGFCTAAAVEPTGSPTIRSRRISALNIFLPDFTMQTSKPRLRR